MGFYSRFLIVCTQVELNRNYRLHIPQKKVAGTPYSNTRLEWKALSISLRSKLRSKCSTSMLFVLTSRTIQHTSGTRT